MQCCLHRSPIVPIARGGGGRDGGGGDDKQVLASFAVRTYTVYDGQYSDLCICTCVGDIYKPTRRPPGTIGLLNFSTYLPPRLSKYIGLISLRRMVGWA